MVEKQGAKLKAKGKGGTAPSEAKGNPKCKASGGPTAQVPKKGCGETLPALQGPWWSLPDPKHLGLPLL
jgi:hypothetical protein